MSVNRLFVWLFLIVGLGQFQVHGQEIKIRTGFVEDSLGIGEPVQFWLSASYPAEIEVILPDSAYDFSPFEIVEREFTPTRAEGDMALDSAVYTLQSFEIDLVQYLSVDAYVLNGSDSTVISSNLDSIYFKELVATVNDTTQLKTNLAYREVDGVFNYPLWSFIALGIFVLMILTLIIFGRKIARNFKLKKLRREYEQFSYKIGLQINKLKEEPAPMIAEDALTDWKKYLERLEKVPYSKYTTKEILAYDNNQELKDTLKIIDRTVYGKMEQKDIFKSFQDIEDFTQHRYTMALDRIKNGE
ncbi:MAG: hypothetical protein R8G66_04550 [Cytophagales bacterium]|nr:hypothetical protein [Cytophagales bacterium]